MRVRSALGHEMMAGADASARDAADSLQSRIERGRGERSRSILSDLREFVLQRPEDPTLVDSRSPEEREDYSQRMLQRLDIRVDDYAVLNIHRINICAPVTLAFEVLRSWDGLSSWWPNRLVAIDRVAGGLEHIRVFFLGRRKHPFGLKIRLFGFNVIPLFELRSIRVREVPGPMDCDNARYLLFDCCGGYPVGIVACYVRSAIADRAEDEHTQFFFAVGFDFDGKAHWRGDHIMNRIWQMIHNRVTANVLNRFKRDCEARFQRILDGGDQPLTPAVSETPGGCGLARSARSGA